MSARGREQARAHRARIGSDDVKDFPAPEQRARTIRQCRAQSRWRFSRSREISPARRWRERRWRRSSGGRSRAAAVPTAVCGQISQPVSAWKRLISACVCAFETGCRRKPGLVFEETRRASRASAASPDCANRRVGVRRTAPASRPVTSNSRRSKFDGTEISMAGLGVATAAMRVIRPVRTRRSSASFSLTAQ